MSVISLSKYGKDATIPASGSSVAVSFEIDTESSILAVYFVMTDNTNGSIVQWNQWGNGVINAGHGTKSNLAQNLTLENCYLMSTLYSAGSPFEASTNINEASEAACLTLPLAPLSFARVNKNFSEYSLGMNNTKRLTVSFTGLSGGTNTQTLKAYALTVDELKTPSTNYMRILSNTETVTSGSLTSTISLSASANSRLNAIVFSQGAGGATAVPIVHIRDNNSNDYVNAPSILCRKANINLGGNAISNPTLAGNAYIWNFNAENTVNGGIASDISTSFTIDISGLSGTSLTYSYAEMVGR